MVCMALSWAVQEVNAGLESYPGKQTVAQFGCSKTTTSLPRWFDSVSAVAFLVEELYCVVPPPHPSSNDVDMPWRQFGWHVFPPPCWEHHRSVAKQIGQRKSLPLQHTLQIDKPHLCLSTALSRIPGFHFWKKEQVGGFSDTRKPSMCQQVEVSPPGPAWSLDSPLPKHHLLYVHEESSMAEVMTTLLQASPAYIQSQVSVWCIWCHDME